MVGTHLAQLFIPMNTVGELDVTLDLCHGVVGSFPVDPRAKKMEMNTDTMCSYWILPNIYFSLNKISLNVFWGHTLSIKWWIHIINITYWYWNVDWVKQGPSTDEKWWQYEDSLRSSWIALSVGLPSQSLSSMDFFGNKNKPNTRHWIWL